MRVSFRILLTLSVAAVLTTPAGAVEVTANFTGGNSDVVVDGFPGMAGDGWTDAWYSYATRCALTTTALQPGEFGFDELGTGTGTYLDVTMTPTTAGRTGAGSVSRRYYDGIDLTEPHVIEFQYRVNEDLSVLGTFGASDDRYQLFDAADDRATANSTCSWIVGVYGSASAGWIYPEQVGHWLFYNGDNGATTDFNKDYQVDTQIVVQAGVTYQFRITIDPVAKTYDAWLSDGVNAPFSQTGLRWRTGADTVAGRIQFGSIADGLNDTRKFSLDAVKITGTSTAPVGGLSPVVARFTGGNSDLVVDGYAGKPGDGWKTAWLAPAYNGGLVSASVSTLSEVKPGSGEYLGVTVANSVNGTSHGGVTRSYRANTGPGIDWTKDHKIEFTVRIDEDVDNEFVFADFADRYTFFDSPVVQSGTGNNCTWIISAYGAAGDYARPEIVGQWSFYDGDRQAGGLTDASNVDTDVALVTNGVYTFTIVVHPATQSYDASVTGTTGSFSATGLGWRTNATSAGGYLTFSGRANAFDDVRAFSLDDLVITQLASTVPGDADGNGVVNHLDAAVLARNWLQNVGGKAADGDFNEDGWVDDLDASILAANWAYTGGAAAVPEPGSLALVLLGLAGVCSLRLQRRG